MAKRSKPISLYDQATLRGLHAVNQVQVRSRQFVSAWVLEVVQTEVEDAVIRAVRYDRRKQRAKKKVGDG